MVVNPLLMSKYSIKEIIFIICHEIEHLVLNHPAEGLRLNKEKDFKKHMLLNVAMDASVNDRLAMEIEKYNIGMMECPEDLITSRFLSEKFNKVIMPLRVFTYYYQMIPEDMVQIVEISRVDSHDWTENDLPEDVEATIKIFVDIDIISSESVG